VSDRRDARTFFDAIARRYDRVYALSGATSRERLARVLAILEGRTQVLVLGLGTGRELPALLDAGHEPTGFDISPAMIALCNKRSRTVPIVVGDFWQPLPFEDRSFDAAVALHGTLAHPPAEASVASLARELARILRPNGVFVAEVPAAEALAAMSRGADDTTLGVEVIGPSKFRHRDAVAGVELEGIALDAAGWQRAFGDALEVRISPLGEVEHLLVAAPRGMQSP
jgi:SAM-dependent methyltransferase